MTDPETTPPQGSPFWRFSLQFYRQGAVADACIALQEDAGVDVNLLLFLLWLAGKQRQLAAVEIAALDQRVRDWRDSTVKPLRAIRRDLKTAPDLVAAPLAEAFRTRIKAAELEADSGLAAARANLDAYARVRDRSFAPAAVATLLAAFDTLQRKPGEE